jgi:hypothetical protein
MSNVINEIERWKENGVKLKSNKVKMMKFIIVMGNKKYRGNKKFDEIIK